MKEREAIARRVAHLAPNFGRLLDLAAKRALRLHADTVTVEHLVAAAIEDEDTAANAVVEHAFADPETVAVELLALSPGLMVVGSASALPFSTLAVGALHAARADAAASGCSEVEAMHLLLHGIDALPADARRELEAAGYGRPESPSTQSANPLAADGPLFRHFSSTAKQVLSGANRLAHAKEEPSIGPAQVALSALRTEDSLASQCGLSFQRARMVLEGRTLDATQPPERDLEPDAELLEFLEKLPRGAASLELLVACHRSGSNELRELLLRHKITLPLLERSIGAFEDGDSCR